MGLRQPHGRRGRAGRQEALSARAKNLAGAPSFACDQLRRYGGQEPAVAVRLMKMLRDVSASAPDEVRPRLPAEVERLLKYAERNAKETDDLEPIRAEAKTALEWIDGNIAAEDTTFVRL